MVEQVERLHDEIQLPVLTDFEELQQEHFCVVKPKANATAFRQWRSWLGGGFEPPTFGLCDLTHLSMRVGLYLHPRGMPAIQSLRLPPPFQGLGSVLPCRSRDVGSTDFDE